jgi:peptide/nickel transport system permease protein
LPILIIVSAIDMGKLGIPQSLIEHSFFSLYKIVLMIALFAWPLSARLVRGATLSAKENLYVLAARSLGASRLRIMIRHILPNVIAPLIVATTLAVGNVIILEASLSFLGLGVQPPVASWGNMLQGAEDFIWDAPMLALWPGLAIFITVIAFNIAGDALRQAYNPKS